MSLKSEYWFIQYDRDFADKEFAAINFRIYETLITSLPQFRQLSNEYPESQVPIERAMQERIKNVLDTLMQYFNPNNPAINICVDQPWIDFVQRTQHYINCEKLYALMFWRFSFNSQFVMKRVVGFYLRFVKFLEAFHYSLFKENSLKQPLTTSASPQKLNFQMKAQEQMKKSTRMESVKKNLYADYQSLVELMSTFRSEIESIQQENKRQVPMLALEGKLFSKLLLFTTQFLKLSMMELSTEMLPFSDQRLVVDILHSNDSAKKGLDNFLGKAEKELLSQTQEDESRFRSTVFKEINNEYESKFRPIAESQATEERFWEDMEKYRRKQKKKNAPPQPPGLTTNREQSIMASSMNTEQTDDGFIPDNFEDFNQSSISKSLRQERFEQKFDDSSKKSFLDSMTFGKSPNNPDNTNNLMMQFLVPEVQEYTNKMKAQSKQKKVDTFKMKYGNESQKDIVKALRNSRKQKQLNRQNHKFMQQQQQQQAAAAANSNNSEMEDEESSEDDENGDDNQEYDEEEEEDEDDVQEESQQMEVLSSRNKQLDFSRVMDFVRVADASLVAIKDSDIDFDQSKTTRLGIKRTNDPNSTVTTRTTAASSSDLNSKPGQFLAGVNAGGGLVAGNTNGVVIAPGQGAGANGTTSAKGVIGGSINANISSAQPNQIFNEEDDDDDEEVDPIVTPQKRHLLEQGQDYKDDDIFDYSYEKDDEDSDEDSDESYFQSSGEDSDVDDSAKMQSLSSRQRFKTSEKVKLHVPFTQFKSQIENSFIRFLKESVYSQDDAEANSKINGMSNGRANSSSSNSWNGNGRSGNASGGSAGSNGLANGNIGGNNSAGNGSSTGAGNSGGGSSGNGGNIGGGNANGSTSAIEVAKKRKPNVSLKAIFPDNRAMYLNGNSFVHYFRENFWMVLNNFVKKNKIQKQELNISAPIIQRKKRINACEYMHINY